MTRLARSPLTSLSLAAVALVTLQAPLWSAPRQTGDLQVRLAPNALGFGDSVAVDGDWVVAGARYERNSAGTVFAYRLENDTWVERQLIHSAGRADDELGTSVAIDGDVIVAGAPAASSSRGEVVVFRFDGTDWQEEQVLAPSARQTGDRFGDSVAVSGDRIVAGSPSADDVGNDSGRAYVYTRISGVWQLTQTLIATDAANNADFGKAVAITGKTIAVGAPQESASEGGTVYIYELEGLFWVETMIKEPDSTGPDSFGLSVDLDGDRLIAGSNGSTYGNNTGSASIFVRSDIGWTREALLLPPDRDLIELGASVALSKRHALAGAPANATRGRDTGSAYTVSFDGTRWTLFQSLFPRTEDDQDELGTSVALGEGLMAVGSPGRREVAVYAYDDLALETGALRPQAGDPLVFETRGGLAGAPTILLVVEVDNQPFTFVTAMGTFGADGEWVLHGTTPPGLAGLKVLFQSFGLHQPDALGASTRRVVRFR